MPDIYHDIEYRKIPVAFDEAETPTLSESDYMIIWVKNPIGDPEPTAPEFEGLDLSDTIVLEDEPDADDTLTTTFYYELPSGWVWNVARYNTSPIPPPPDNELTFQYQDRQDVKQGYTSQVYFTAT